MKRKVYVAIWDDRHTDTTVHVFTDAQQAIDWARDQARVFDRFGDLDETLTDAMTLHGWLYNGRYSCESDSIRVVTCTVDEEVTPGAT